MAKCGFANLADLSPLGSLSPIRLYFARAPLRSEGSRLGLSTA